MLHLEEIKKLAPGERAIAFVVARPPALVAAVGDQPPPPTPASGKNSLISQLDKAQTWITLAEDGHGGSTGFESAADQRFQMAPEQRHGHTDRLLVVGATGQGKSSWARQYIDASAYCHRDLAVFIVCGDSPGFDPAFATLLTFPAAVPGMPRNKEGRVEGLTLNWWTPAQLADSELSFEDILELAAGRRAVVVFDDCLKFEGKEWRALNAMITAVAQRGRKYHINLLVLSHKAADAGKTKAILNSKSGVVIPTRMSVGDVGYMLRKYCNINEELVNVLDQLSDRLGRMAYIAIDSVVKYLVADKQVLELRETDLRKIITMQKLSTKQEAKAMVAAALKPTGP